MNANRHFEKIRQIAIFVDRLDRGAADQLLDGFPPEQQREIRDAMMSLSEISMDEAAEVSRGFYLRLKGTPEPVSDDSSSGDSSSNALGAQAPSHSFTDSPIAAGQPVTAPPPFPSAEMKPSIRSNNRPTTVSGPLAKCLARISIDALRSRIQLERPQVIAIVAASLTPTRAAELIGKLPPSNQSSILQRIAALETADEQAVAELQQELSERFDSLAHDNSPTAAGIDRLRSIVSAADGRTRRSLLHLLGDTQPEMACQLSPDESVAPTTHSATPLDPHEIAIAFDRFVDLDRPLLHQVFEELGIEIASLALRGASQPCLVDVLKRLPPESSQAIKETMESLGPVRLSDIHQAQAAAVVARRKLLSHLEGQFESSSLKLTA